jgi:hypothetical protein
MDEWLTNAVSGRENLVRQDLPKEFHYWFV